DRRAGEGGARKRLWLARQGAGGRRLGDALWLQPRRLRRGAVAFLCRLGSPDSRAAREFACLSRAAARASVGVTLRRGCAAVPRLLPARRARSGLILSFVIPAKAGISTLH